MHAVGGLETIVFFEKEGVSLALQHALIVNTMTYNIRQLPTHFCTQTCLYPMILDRTRAVIGVSAAVLICSLDALWRLDHI